MRIAIIGAGGFAREVRWLIEDISKAGASLEFAGFLVSNPTEPGKHDESESIAGGFDLIGDEAARIDALALGIGNPAVRYKLGRDLSAKYPHAAWPSLIHPSVSIDDSSSSVGIGSTICAGNMITVNVEIGDFAMINLGCTVGHEARLGKGSVVNPLCAISGGVVIGDRTMIGTGAKIMQYLAIGDDATVGAGAVVTKNVDSGLTVVGVPARSLGA